MWPRWKTTAGAPTLWTAPVLLAVTVVIGTQLLPAGSVEGVQVRIERLQPALLALALALITIMAAATVPSRGVAPFIYFRF